MRFYKKMLWANTDDCIVVSPAVWASAGAESNNNTSIAGKSKALDFMK
jgi:hypothetical protein